MAFTLVFKDSMPNVNPFKTETPFGVAHSAGIGDAFERIDQLEEALLEAGVAVPEWSALSLRPDAEREGCA